MFLFSLLAKGIDVNSKDDKGMTALMEACIFGETDIVKVLLEHEADVDATDDSGKKALMHAALFEEFGIIRLLIKDEADLHSSDNNEHNALALVAASTMNASVKGAMTAFLRNLGLKQRK